MRCRSPPARSQPAPERTSGTCSWPPRISRFDDCRSENTMNMREFATTVALLICGTAVQAGDVVVIVNKANDNAVDKSLVAKIYTGESKLWGGGGAINAYDLPED